MEPPLDPATSHPVLVCAVTMRGALDEVQGVDPLYLPPAAKATAMRELSQVIGRAQGLLLRVLATAEDVAHEAGARSPAAWLAHQTRTNTGTTHRQAQLAHALDTRWHQLADAVAAGGVNLEQAHTIAQGLGELPDGLDPEILTRAEAHLIQEAGHFDAKRLKILGRRVLDVIAPEVAEDHERRRLEEEEHRARTSTRLRLRRRGDGTTDLTGRISDAHAARLKTYLEAFTSPRRAHLPDAIAPVDPDTGQRVPYEVRMGHALGALLEALPTEVLPQHGGAPTTVVVTIDFDRLKDRVGAATLDTGNLVSATEAMRLACNADLVPLVLGGQAQPLHLGHARRLFDKDQRLVMAIRDGECRAEGCDIPAAWCEAHHRNDWCRGGKTDIEDGVLLCPWHHHRAHDPTFDTQYLLNGDVRFRRRI